MQTSIDTILARWGQIRAQGIPPKEAMEQITAEMPEHARQEVRRALSELRSIDDWLETLDQTDEDLNEIFGESSLPKRYRLQDKIGQGGMGVIHRAVDQELDREVAIKMLLDRYDRHSSVAQRFIDEARIMGQLQHPGIPAIHELGVLTDGRPFLAMKLVKGRTLAHLMEERTDPLFQQAQFLAQFEQVCQAVGYAHSRHVIHRDLKPSNVMIGAFGEVQVMDWGLAKILKEPGAATEQMQEPKAAADPITMIKTARTPDSETQAGSILGTPSYMAPEQAAGELHKLDSRTDVFALGAMLCEILTGAPPYQGSEGDLIWMQAMRGQWLEAQQRLESCGANPELIALTKSCLEIDQAKRPQAAWQVAEVLARIRAQTEERARQAEMERVQAIIKIEEGRKRRRVWYIVGACLLLGMVASSTLAVMANHAREAAELAELEEAQANRQAQAHLERSIQAIEEMLLRVSDEKLANLPHAETLRRELTLEAGRLLEDLLREESKNPSVLFASARTYKQIGSLEQLLGNTPAAEKALGQAVDLLKLLVKSYPKVPSYQDRLAACYYDLAIIHRQKREYTAGLASIQQAIDLWTALLQHKPKEAEFRYGLGIAWLVRGWLSMDNNHTENAKLCFRNSVEEFTTLLQGNHNHPRYEQELARAYHFLGWLASDQNDLEQAKEFYLASVAIRKRLARDHANLSFTVDLGYSYNNLGVLHRRLQQYSAAESYYRQGMAIFQKLATDFPQVPEYKNMVGLLINNLVHDRLQQNKDLASCLPLLQEARMQLQSIVSAAPGQRSFKLNLGQAIRYQAEVHYRLDEHHAALMLLNELHQQGPEDGESQWYIASVYARELAMVQKNEKMSLPERQSRVQQLGDKAMMHLQQAIKVGYLDLIDLKEGKAFEALRLRTDFQELLKRHSEPKH